MLKKILSHYALFVDAAILVFILFFIFSYFQPNLLFLKTTISGGDTGSHYPCAAHLKEVLLPQGKIMGWMQGNYAGFPLFYHYFPLPFLLAAFLSYFISLEVSFKLLTVLGTFFLPFSVYFAFRLLKYSFPAPIFAATFCLAFLFNQGNSMWGGNIPSTLAGEFCYSLGMALVFLFLGTLYRGVTEKKYLIPNALLVFLIGLSHAYILIFCLVLGAFFALDDFKNNFKYLLGVYGLGFLLLSFWLLPVLANLPYTTAFVFRWTINSISEVFPNILLPFVALSLIAFFFNRKDRRSAYFLFLLFACAVIYLAGPRVGILDIRFIPFIQVILAVFGATILERFGQNLKLTFILPFILFFAAAVWVDMNATYIRSWISWNYSGYEKKTTWNVFHGINEYLKRSGPGRVEWEHNDQDDALGSIRSSETLPYFAKRQTLEGIHMLGSLTAPFVFYIESETSYQSCNPIPDYFYSTLDLKRGIDHFRLFNVSHFVVRSSQVKDVIKHYPEFKLEKVIGEYHIYRLLTDDHEYVVPLKNQPVLFSTSDWRDISYQWFAREKLKDTFLVFMKKAGEKEVKIFGKAVSDLGQARSIAYSKKNIRVKSDLREETIDIETSEIGRPLLIKVSYHPNWRVKGADKIYFASPSFMLIYPKEHKIHLSFEPGFASKIGWLLTLSGMILIIFSPFWLNNYLGGGEVKDKEKITGEWPVYPHTKIFGVGVYSVLALVITGAFLIFNYMAPSMEMRLKKGRADFDRGRYSLAREKLSEVIAHSKMSSGARCEAKIFYATAFLREQKYKEAKAAFEQFIRDYPNSYWTPQAYFDLADCEINLKNRPAANLIYHKILRDFPATTWAQYSKVRLK